MDRTWVFDAVGKVTLMLESLAYKHTVTRESQDLIVKFYYSPLYNY